jgi:radical SAM protein (TIGR01212 family)
LASLEQLRAQWDRGRQALRRRYGAVDGFIAYFQAFSNTDAPLAALRQLYDPLPTGLPECCGLSISTRPDCVPDPVLDYLAAKAADSYLCLELGLQSASDRVLRRYNRGHSVAECIDAVERAAARGLELCVHVMLGLPGEEADAAVRLGRLLAGLPVRSIKVHNFHIMRGTPLARAHDAGSCPAPSRDAYRTMLGHLLAELRPDQCLQRVIADAPDRLLVSDGWCHDKQGFLAQVAADLPPLGGKERGRDQSAKS